jgi:hypothetical protein
MELTVRTRWRLPRTPDKVWPLLTKSRMEPECSVLFLLGVPEPQECRLPDGQGGVGSRRECVSDQGVVEQRILEWDEPRTLSFRAERTDLGFKNHVTEIVERFELVPDGPGATLATRTTQVRLRDPWAFLRRIMLAIGLKKVHRFVFGNWERACREATGGSGPGDRSP